jgi:hypothetical protein
MVQHLRQSQRARRSSAIDVVKEDTKFVQNGMSEVMLTLDDVDVKVKSEDIISSPEKSNAVTLKRGAKRMLFDHLPSATKQAKETFMEIQESIYQFDDLAESQQQDVMACDCKPLQSGAPPHATH